MTPLLVVLMLVVGGAGLGALLIKFFGDSQRRAGQLEKQNEVNQGTIEATRRADDVLAESRDPDDVAERLRRHDF